MSTEEYVLRKYGGVNNNSLNQVLNLVNNNDRDESEIEDFNIIKHSPYVNNNEFISFCIERRKHFTILSLNIQSIHAKFDQLQILLNELKQHQFEFSAICLQETWLSDDSDLRLIQIPGYTMISQGSICTSHGGLAIYLNELYKHKLLPLYKKTLLGKVSLLK